MRKAPPERLLGWNLATSAGAGLVPRGIRPQRSGSGVRYGKRPGRLGGRERVGRRRPGVPGMGWIRLGGARFRRERLGLVHWRDGH